MTLSHGIMKVMMMRIFWLQLTKPRTRLANNVSIEASNQKIFRKKAGTPFFTAPQ